MRLTVIGLNHKTAPIDVREKFAVSKDEILRGLKNIAEYGASEAVFLNTCNRSELYAVTEEEADENLCQFIFDLTGASRDCREYFYSYAEEDCIRHLFKVAAGLDSLVLGEGQILSQVKEAYAAAKEIGITGTILNTLMHRAIKTGKRVRAETGIDQNSVSVSYSAVKLAENRLNALKGRAALIFGAGKMAHLTAMHLSSNGIEKIFVANRHIEKAQTLAEEIGGEAVPFDKALNFSDDVDVIVTSTGAPHYVIKPWETRRLMSRRNYRELIIIDIAVPRDVDPDVGRIKGVTLYNIDDLTALVDEHFEERRREIKPAAKIIDEEFLSVMNKFRYLSFRPLMALLSDRAERIREREVRRSAGKLADLNEDEWRQINRMTKMIVRKILRAPMIKLNSSAGKEEGEYYARALRNLFKLDTIGDNNNGENRRYRYAGQ